MASHQKMTNLKQIKKTHFRVKIWVRIKIKLKTDFETINFIYPEILGFLGLFLKEIEQHEKMPSTQIGTIVSNKVILLKSGTQNIV